MFILILTDSDEFPVCKMTQFTRKISLLCCLFLADAFHHNNC